MKASSRVTINTGILYARMAITVFISLYTTRLVLDALGASDFGVFQVVASAIGMLGFLNAAMSAATQRFMSYAEGEGKKEKQIQIFNASVVLHFLIGIFMVLVMEGVGHFLFNGILEIPADRMEAAKVVFHFAVAMTWVNVLSVPYNAVINAHENMLFLAVIEIIDKLLKLVLAFYITYSPFSYDKLVAYGFFMAVISFLLLLIRHWYCSGKYEEVKFGIFRYYDRSMFKEMGSFAGWSFLSSSTSMISNYGQGIVLNMFFGTVVNAAQGVANDLSGKVGAFSTTMRRALNPVIDKSEGAGDRSKMLKTAILGGKMSFYLLIIFGLPIIIEMPMILNFWLHDIPKWAIIFCQLALVKSMIDQLFVTLVSSIAAVGNIRNFKIAESITHALPLILGYVVFTMGFKPYWIYIVFIFSQIINSGVILFYAGRVTGLSIPSFLKHTVLRSLLTLGVVIALDSIPYLFMSEDIIRLLAIGFLNGVGLIGTIWVVGLQDYEQAIFRDIIIKIKSNGISYLRNYSTK